MRFLNTLKYWLERLLMKTETTIDWSDSKIKFIVSRCENKNVLDLGCVEHSLDRFSNSKWVHRALKDKADDLIGLDYLEDEVKALREVGLNIIYGNAEDFNLGAKFDVIVAGDLIEHLNNYGNFIKCCVEHMTEQSLLIITSANPWHWHKVVRSSLGEVPVNFEHTCWMTPICLNQLCERYGLKLTAVEYGSSRLRDSFLPLPKRLRHSSWYAELKLAR